MASKDHESSNGQPGEGKTVIRITAAVQSCEGISIGEDVELRCKPEPTLESGKLQPMRVPYVFGVPEVWSEGRRVKLRAIQSVTIRFAPHEFAMVEIHAEIHDAGADINLTAPLQTGED